MTPDVVLSSICQENDLTIHAVFSTKVFFYWQYSCRYYAIPWTDDKNCLFFPVILLTVQRHVVHVGIPYLLQIKTYLWQSIAVVESLTFVINIPLTPHVLTDCSAGSKHARRAPLTTPLADHSPWLRSPISQLLQEGNDTIGCKCSLTNCKFI